MRFRPGSTRQGPNRKSAATAPPHGIGEIIARFYVLSTGLRPAFGETSPEPQPFLRISGRNRGYCAASGVACGSCDRMVCLTRRRHPPFSHFEKESKFMRVSLLHALAVAGAIATTFAPSQAAAAR